MLPRPGAVLLLLALVCGPARAADVLSLDGREWTVRNSNGSVNVRATVPGGIYTDLLAANVLTSDFLFGNNDELQRWVSYENWTYERTFEVSESLASRRHAQLVFHGADTVATVELNGERLGALGNMFVRYALPTGTALRAGTNRLAVEFTPSPVEAQRRYDAYRNRHGYNVPPQCVPDDYHGECHANHLRKMQASFSWDWGPAFPSSGLWKGVTLEAFDSAVLRDVTVRFEEPSGGGGGGGGEAEAAATAALHVRAFLEAGAGAGALNGVLRARLQLPGGPAHAEDTVSLDPDARGECVADITIRGFEEPPRWWPNGEGDQPLLPLTVTFTGSDGVEASSVSLRVAYLTVELVQEPIATSQLVDVTNNVSENDVNYDRGLTFHFRVNGRPIYAKGSNWIPASVLPELGTDPATVRHLLESARDTHTNMLRVWGGGVYESDFFYDLADELGILIWQDFMFACSMYPADEEFLATVRQEVTQQVRRLQTHASVALWAGNNENEGALVDNWYGTSSNYQQYKDDYVTLYAHTIRQLVLELDPTREFVVSSPSNGLKTDEEGYVSTNPSSPHYGDIHYYNYLSDAWNPDTYPQTRFASEYGFQSLPSLATLSPVATSPEDLSANSSFMKSRQHHPNGYPEMVALARQRLPVPDNWDTVEGFPAFIFVTQMFQAMATQTETEHYRRMRSQLNDNGEGLCMGALYWQLNDVWQAPTWSSIDINGRWKPLQYFAEEFFAPQMASAYVDTASRLHVWALNDHQEPVMAVVLQGRAGSWSDRWGSEGTAAAVEWRNLSDLFQLGAARSQHVLTEDVEDILRSLPGCGVQENAAAHCFLEVRLLATVDGTALGPTRAVLPVSLARVRGMTAPNVTVKSVSEPSGDGRLEVVVTSDRPAAFAWLEADAVPGRFTRNAFLMADASETLHFLPRNPSTPPSAEELSRALSVTSLANLSPPTENNRRTRNSAPALGHHWGK